MYLDRKALNNVIPSIQPSIHSISSSASLAGAAFPEHMKYNIETPLFPFPRPTDQSASLYDDGVLWVAVCRLQIYCIYNLSAAALFMEAISHRLS